MCCSLIAFVSLPYLYLFVYIFVYLSAIASSIISDFVYTLMAYKRQIVQNYRKE